MRKDTPLDPVRSHGSASETIHVRPLRLADVAAMAELERLAYPAEMRAGAAQLMLDFEEAALDGSNLGCGLFDGPELVGVCLTYYEPDSRRIFSYFDLPCPEDVIAEECLYLADLTVKPGYSRHMQRLLKGSWRESSPEYRSLPIYGFSSAIAVARWRKRQRVFSRVGYDYVGERRFALSQAPHEIFLVRFEARAPPLHEAPAMAGIRIEEFRTQRGWRSLEPHWDALLRETPDSTGFQSLRVQQIWSQHLLVNSRLFILAAYQGAELRAIAPLRIETTEYYGQERRLLKFIGEPNEMDRPTILRRGEDPEVVRALFKHVLERRSLWDSMLLYEQPKDGTVLRSAMELFDTPDWLLGVVEGPPCPWVDVRGSWQGFLASKPRSFRKQLALKRNRLAREGPVRFATYETWPALAEGFELYLAVERRSWKPTKGLGVAKDAASLRYHKALVEELGPLGKVQCRVLFVGERPIAASLGLFEHGRFLSLHICHDAAYAHFSPGVLLTAYELEACYARPDCTDYDFLGGFLSNKLTWTAKLRETRQFYVYGNTLFFRVHYAWHFNIAPRLKTALRRVGLLDPVLKLTSLMRRVRQGRPTEEGNDAVD